MSVIVSNILAGASGQGGGYNLTKSLRFRSSASAYLNRTPASATNQKTWTFSAWVKRGTLSSTQIIAQAGTGGTNFTYIAYFNSSDQLVILDSTVSGVSSGRTSVAVFRDPSAWYHVVVNLDATNSVCNGYVNGVAQTFTGTQPSNQDWAVNSTIEHRIGRAWASNTSYIDGYLAEVNFIDGQALTPSSFGETSTSTGVWIPKKYTGTYGTNGFYLPFTDTTSTSTLGTDFSGNSNTWTVNNISLTSGSTYDSMTDVPTLTSATTANYATLNPTVPKTYCTQTDGNLKSAGTTSTDSDTSVATIGVSSGKWYWEDKIGTISSAVYPILGAGRNILSSFVGAYPGIASVGGFGIVVGNGNIVREGTTVTTVTALVANDVVGFALDLGALTCAIYKNNSLIYTVTGLTAGTYYPMANEYSNSNSTHNYGQQPFAYTPPTGFVALNTFNLPTPTIGATASSQANKYFDATTFTGNASTNVITNSGSMQPDMVWLKSRSNANSHTLYDAIRGVNTLLYPNLTNAEAVGTNQLTSFNSNGFTLGASENANDDSGESSVGWQWRASNATAVTNTAGTIASTVSANTTAGFSIVTYTITSASSTISTFGHGLGVAPSMVILKVRNAVDEWTVYHSSIPTPNSNWVTLNTTNAAGGSTSTFSSSSSTFGVRETRLVGSGSSGNVVAYCFAQVAGYSAFGSYTGNGSSDGTFVFTGFRPRFVMFKRTDAVEQWAIRDTARDTYNATELELFPNLSNAEEDNNLGIDLLSNGFKIRNSANRYNASSGTYIYMAFCESPFRYANAR